MKSQISVFNHNDYRELLRAWYWNTKQHNKKLSFRYVSRYLSLRSPNHFHLVISKKRHLSAPTLERVLKLLQLDAKEKQYFRLIFKENTAKNAHEKQEHQSKIDLLRRQLISDEVHDEELKIVGNHLAWYIKMGSIVFEGKTKEQLIDLVAQSSRFPVNSAEIENALQILIQTEQLKFERGLSRFEEGQLTTKWDLDRTEIKRHHVNNLRLAMETAAWPIDQRFFSGVTIACDQELYQQIVADIRNLCLSVLERSNSKILRPEDAQTVVTLQHALFPYFSFQNPAKAP